MTSLDIPLVVMPLFLGTSSFIVEHAVASAELACNKKFKFQNSTSLTAEKRYVFLFLLSKTVLFFNNIIFMKIIFF